MKHKLGKWPNWIQNTSKPVMQTPKKHDVNVTFVNHATFLIQTSELTIIFDPMFSTTAGPNKYLGIQRRRKPGIEIDALPKIQYIFISHNHYDHLDLPSLQFIANRDNPFIFVPLGNKIFLMERGFTKVIEMDWWDKYTPERKDTEFHFTPSQHNSGRGIFDRNKTLWGSFVVKLPEITIYHAGDTGYSTHFKDIARKFNIDLALLPIGDSEPNEFLRYMHMNPEDAIQAHIDLNSKLSFSMHSETFRLSYVDYNEPEQLLEKIKTKLKINNFTTLDVGETRTLNRASLPKI